MINNQLQLDVKATGLNETKKGFSDLAKVFDETKTKAFELIQNLNPLGQELNKIKRSLNAINKPVELKIGGVDQHLAKIKELNAEIAKIKGNMPKGNMPKIPNSTPNSNPNPTLPSSPDKDISGWKDAMSTLAKGAGIAATAIVTIGTAAAGAAVKVLDLSKTALDLASQGESIKALSSSFYLMGGSARGIEELRAATGGAVSDLELMKAANKAALFDIPKAEIPKLVKLAVGASAMMGTDLGQAIDDVFTGVGRKSMEIADNMGILISVGEANDKLAKKLGKSVSSLTQQEKTMAFAQEMVAKGTRQMEAAQISLQGSAGPAQAALANLWDGLKVGIYEAAKEAGLFKEIIDGTGKASTPLKELAARVMDALVPALRTTIDMMPVFLGLMNDALSLMKLATDVVADWKKRTGGKVFEGFWGPSPEELGAVVRKGLMAQMDEVNKILYNSAQTTKAEIINSLKANTEVIGVLDALGIKLSPEEGTQLLQQFQTDFEQAFKATQDFDKAYGTATYNLMQNKGWNLSSQQIDRLSGSLKGLSAQIRVAKSLDKTGFTINQDNIKAVDDELGKILKKQINIAKQEAAVTGELVDMHTVARRASVEFAALGGSREKFGEMVNIGYSRGLELLEADAKARKDQRLAVIKNFEESRSLMSEDYNFQRDYLYAKLELNGKTEKEITDALQAEYDARITAAQAFYGENTVGFQRYANGLNSLFDRLRKDATKPTKTGGAAVDKITPILQRAELVGKTDFQKKIIEADRQFVKDLKDSGSNLQAQRASRVLHTSAYISAIAELGRAEVATILANARAVADSGRDYAQALEERMGIMRSAQKEILELRNKEGKFAFKTDTGYVSRQKSDREIAIEQELQALRDEWTARKQILQEGSDAYIAAQQSFNLRTQQLREEQSKETSTQNLDKQLEDFFGPLQSFQSAFSSISGTYQELISEGTLAEQQTAQAIGGLLSLADATVGMQEEIKKTQQAVIDGKMKQEEADISMATTGLSVGLKAAKSFFKNKQAEYFLEGMGETAKAAGQFALGNVPGGIAHGLAAALFYKAAARGGGGGGQAKQAPARRSAAGSDRSSTAGDSRRALNQVNIFINPITGQAMVNEINKEGNRREGTKIASRLISTTPRRSDM